MTITAAQLAEVNVRLILPKEPFSPAPPRQVPLTLIQSGESQGVPYALVRFAGEATLRDRIALAMYKRVDSTATDVPEALREDYLGYADAALRTLM